MLRRNAVFLLTLALLPGLCSAQAQTQAPGGVWVDVPYVAQQGEGCGAAAIAMVMQYWDRERGNAAEPKADYIQIDKALYSPKAHGIYASAMERYFRENGYQTFTFAGVVSDLTQHLAKGRPLIAALQPGAGQPLHYVVVAGVDPARHTVLVNDPAQRKLMQEDSTRFEQEWKATGHWTLLAVPEKQ
ncbi:MAG: C39 family peptidase [Terracidiphilus sp.]|nr:C39 family peptidase [Terracidiphilus sp.]